MKTLKIIVASSVIAVASLSVTAQADELMDIIHPESADLFPADTSLKPSEPTGIKSYSDVNGDIVWSTEYEEYVNTADFVADNSINSAQGINRYMESNPTAAGQSSEEVFKYDETYGGYMLQ
ncbi:MAG: hypothetical protein KZQ64_13240 [gamma proteobacterium symbiont of Bathyaustriella thionipta]|nr:hypothetical protein [gamma proteobacterium symbiont of Bathyaustriella thionipta]MCU7950672.1 hypothetical protein [gamma proteobacterium symbiont of Bathyaustriella thionipta]MCU7954333.1 hypothetical protein [gamma proteobacterium symbiont of Bathyaustriella thionipta]MCU7957280.1 hypothetical protein [gamma proteobacterium symbiont of Bathyaustriella thionipta]MCU7968223.1 hypothetical protein [gamma proteobacterium symbiont of Bathyaustriella thionipta]